MPRRRPTGSGKSTLLGAINGLVPHFTGGALHRHGHGRWPRHARPTRRASWPTWSGRRPGPARRVRDRHRRGGAGLRDGAARRSPPTSCASGSRRPSTCSASPTCATGRCARCRAASSSASPSAAVLTAHPKVLVLDEPTSALDPTAAEEVLAAITRLVHDLGHDRRHGRAPTRARRPARRPGRVASPATERVAAGTPAEVLASASVAPPVVELGRLAGWDPLPLSVRDARRLAADRCASGSRRSRRVAAGPGPGDRRTDPRGGHRHSWRAGSRALRTRRRGPRASTSTCDAGEIVAVMGRNGSGQVVAAVGAPGLRPAPSAARSTSPVSDPARSRTRPGAAARRAGARRRPTDLLYLDDGRRRVRAGRPRAGARPARAARCSTAWCRGIGRRPTPRPVRGPAARARARRAAHRDAARWCCSTSRPAASTTPPRGSSRRRCGRSRPAGDRSLRRRPTTSSSSRDGRRPGGRAGRGRDRRRRPDRPSRRRRRRRSRRRSPRSSRPVPWLTVDDVVGGPAHRRREQIPA